MPTVSIRTPWLIIQVAVVAIVLQRVTTHAFVFPLTPTTGRHELTNLRPHTTILGTGGALGLKRNTRENHSNGNRWVTNGVSNRVYSVVVVRASLNDNSDGKINNDEVLILQEQTKTEAEQLMARAKAIRDSIPDSSTASVKNTPTAVKQIDAKQSTFSLPVSSPSSSGYNYRLYLNIGREPGTWMDPRWGASGRRIELTLDVSFSTPLGQTDQSSDILASVDIAERLPKTVTSKSSSLSPIYQLQYAQYARLRGGFDKMTINNGGYCIETPTKGRATSTLRFCLSVDGTTTKGDGGTYGDISIPEGYLYFALPYFGMRTISKKNGEEKDEEKQMSLSTKEGTITVKEMGWHTGWWREESRILGVFRAVPLEEARRRDKF